MDFVTRRSALRPWSSLPLSLVLATACGDSDSPDDGTAGADSSSTGGTGSSSGGSTDATATHGTDAPTTESSGAHEHGESADESTGETGGHNEPEDPELPYDPEQLAEVCERGNADPIAERLCATPTPEIHDLADLYQVLGLQIMPSQFALLGNSTSLVARSTSAINPRVMLTLPFEQGIAAVTFSRGEQVVEMVGYDEVADRLNFYLFTFFRPCNDDGGCSLAELFTPEIESGWTVWSLYQDVDLENHTLDCNTCHQPGGPGTPKLLLSNQASEPWMHWFPSFAISTPGDTTSSVELTPHFVAMHGADGQYGGIPMEALTPPNPAASGIVMQQFLDIYWQDAQGGVIPPGLTQFGQPHMFDSAAIEADILAGNTSTWDAYYAQTLTGERMPVPWHHHDITDAALREQAIASYTAVLAGEADPETLYDPRAVLSPQTEVELGMRPRPGASAEEILHHVCQRCHNDELDQTLSRARFNAERPDELTAEQRAAAVARLMAPEGSIAQMPPPRFATLPAAEKQTLIDFLEQ